MKQLTALSLVCLLLFASCQKEPALVPMDLGSDFFDNEVTAIGADKNPLRHSNLKVVIRKAGNGPDTYRLVLKIDSVSINGNGPEEMVALDDDATVTAGLFIPDSKNPDLTQVVFRPNQLTFRKQNENGYYVFVSDPFTSSIKFDYELVEVQYQVISFGGDPTAVTVSKSQFFTLPGGKTIEQDPKPVRGRIDVIPDGRVVYMRLVMADDPIQDVQSILLARKPYRVVNEDGTTEIITPASLAFTKTKQGNNIGVSEWELALCNSLPGRGVWECGNEILDGVTDYTINVQFHNWNPGSTTVRDDLFSRRTLLK